MAKTNEKSKSIKINALFQMIMLAVSLAVYLICQFAVGKDVLGFLPVCTLFITYFLGSFLYGFIGGVIKRSLVGILLGGISGIIGLEILLFAAAGAKFWYVWIIVGVIVAVITLAMATFVKSDKLAIKFDNAPETGRKTYVEKKAEENGETKKAD